MAYKEIKSAVCLHLGPLFVSCWLCSAVCLDFLIKLFNFFVTDLSVDMIFDDEEIYRKHTLKTQGSSKIFCKHCPMQAACKRDILRHIEAVHLNLHLPCCHCEKVFKTRRSLKEHSKKYHFNH